MFKPLSLFLGFRYVRSRHGKGFSSFISASSTIGIALGVMVLIVVLSAMNGFERELAQRLLSVVPHAELITVNEPIDDWRASVKNVQNNNKVISAAPVIKMTGMAQHAQSLKGIQVRGVDVTLEQQVSAITDYMIAGDWQDLAQPNAIILGAGIAKKLQAKLGDQIQILLPQTPKSKQTQQSQADASGSQHFPVPLKRNVNIVGVFKFGGTIDDTLAYVSIEQAVDITGLSLNQAQGIRIKTANVFQAPQIARDVAFTFDHYVYMYDWTYTQGHLFNDIQLVRMVMFIVLVLVIAVASFNIVSTLIMAVNDKKGDIAILKTMGASAPLIMFTFIIQGFVNGILGCLIGGLSGVYLALNLTEIMSSLESLFGVKFLSSDVYFIDFLPTSLHQNDVVITVLVALFLSLIATIYPAWRATKVEPAQVLGQI
ncbi:lipoprotein-releasing ABC transporter permease subunit LolE [Colwelliaceae bacterium 6471]